ncbi:hypothetical protein F5Y13DRAFT_8843 [Hypoxylon sp. FL1857]|nr:hypothetical protein F5Y13DRAFT_8843 [Hypoxylon sp. FL1857]
MARKNGDEEKASSVDDNHAQLLYHSLEQYNKEQKRRRRPSILLAALVALFLSSIGGLTLAIVLLLRPIEIQSACIARDLTLFASCIGLVYVCLHIRGARKDYRRRGPGPPQIYGDYLHASALLVARFGIAVWIAALVATSVMISRAVPADGFAKTAPYLDLVICIGATPSFIAISATIESNPTPFATTGVSRSSFLGCCASEATDDITADLSVSRRASLQRKESTSASVLTVPTAEIFKLGGPKPARASARNPDHLEIRTEDLSVDTTELMANSPIGAAYHIPAVLTTRKPVGVKPLPKLPNSLSKSPPQPVYNPGGWRYEWNSTAEQGGGPGIQDAPLESSNLDRSAYFSSAYSGSAGRSSRTSTPPNLSNETNKGHRATPSTSIASSAHRSRLSTVRYAAEPEIAVRQPIRVIKNPNYWPPTVVDADKDQTYIKPPEPVVVPKGAQQVQEVALPTLKRKPSNFSRPLQSAEGSEVDSAVAMSIPEPFSSEVSRKS